MLVFFGTHDQYRAVGVPYNFLGVGSDKIRAHRWTMRPNDNEISPPRFRFSKNLVVYDSSPRCVRETPSWHIGFHGHLLELRTGGIFSLGADVRRQECSKAVRDFGKNMNHSNCSIRQCRELRCEIDGEFGDRCFGSVNWNKDRPEHLRPLFGSAKLVHDGISVYVNASLCRLFFDADQLHGRRRHNVVTEYSPVRLCNETLRSDLARYCISVRVTTYWLRLAFVACYRSRRPCHFVDRLAVSHLGKTAHCRFGGNKLR
jgi:hypothetical protein